MLKPVDVPCGRCRACCINTLVILMPEQGDDITSYETETEDILGKLQYVLKKKPNGECVYLKKGGCSIHDRAPYMCKIFDCRDMMKMFLSGKSGIGMPAPDIAKAAMERMKL